MTYMDQYRRMGGENELGERKRPEGSPEPYTVEDVAALLLEWDNEYDDGLGYTTYVDESSTDGVLTVRLTEPGTDKSATFTVVITKNDDRE